MFCPECGSELVGGACPKCSPARVLPTLCPNCESKLDGGVCPVCGMDMRPRPEFSREYAGQGGAGGEQYAPGGAYPYPPQIVAAPALTRGEFFRTVFKRKGLLVAAGVTGYFCAALNLMFALINGASGEGYASLVDVVILLGLSLGIFPGKSRVCAVLLAVYALFSMIIWALNGQFSGWLIAVAAGLAIAGTFSFAKEWKAYRAQVGMNA